MTLEEKMHAAAHGDKVIYRQLLQELSLPIRKFLQQQIFIQADIEDVTQEVLIAIHHASHTYSADRPLLPWVYAIARFKALDYLRKHYRHKRHEAIDFDSIFEKFVAPVTDSYDQSETINKLLSILPEKSRRIVEMMKIEGYSATEVAKILNMKVSTVKVTAHRAYQLIAKHHSEDFK